MTPNINVFVYPQPNSPSHRDRTFLLVPGDKPEDPPREDTIELGKINFQALYGEGEPHRRFLELVEDIFKMNDDVDGETDDILRERFERFLEERSRDKEEGEEWATLTSSLLAFTETVMAAAYSYARSGKLDPVE
jgi:hypothetical protein